MSPWLLYLFILASTHCPCPNPQMRNEDFVLTIAFKSNNLVHQLNYAFIPLINPSDIQEPSWSSVHNPSWRQRSRGKCQTTWLELRILRIFSKPWAPFRCQKLCQAHVSTVFWQLQATQECCSGLQIVVRSTR